MVGNKCSKIFLVAAIMILFFLPMTTVFAKGDGTVEKRIYDDAKLLSKEEASQLEKMAKKYSDKRETNFIIVTTEHPKPDDVQLYTEEFYDKKLPGYDKPAGNAAILTVDMKNREVYLAGFYKGEKYLDDHRLDLIRDKISPYITNEEYDKAFQKFIVTADDYMGYWPGIDPDSFFFSFWFQVGAPIGLAVLVLAGMLRNIGGKVTVNSRTYMNRDSFKLRKHRDVYLRKTVDRRRKPSNNNKSGGGGGGGVTRGGHSHSGSRGSF